MTMPAYSGPVTVELEPDYNQALEQFEQWFGDTMQGEIDIGWTDPGTGKLNNFKRFDAGDFDEAAAFVVETNKVPGQSVYYRPALVKAGAGQFVTDSDFLTSPGTWVDLDDEGAAEGARTLASICRPTQVVVTGEHPWKRAQLYWRHSDLVGSDLVRRINVAHARVLQGDTAVVNPTTLMRVAGTIAWPWKDGRVPELTRLVAFKQPRSQSYITAAIVKAFPLEDDATRHKPSVSGKREADPLGLGTHVRVDPVAAVEQALDGNQWHNNLTRAVAHWVNRGLDDREIMLLGRNARTSGYTVEQTDREVLAMIKGARDKWGIENPTHDMVDTAAGISPLTATSVGLIDPTKIPARKWIIDRRLVRGFVSTTIAPGGLGKSTFSMQEAVSICIGRGLTGMTVAEKGRVWVINNEDPREELERRIAAICIHFDVKFTDIADQLYLDSGVDRRLVVARHDDKGGVIATPDVDALIKEITDKNILVLIVDPFVRTHRVSENSNDEIDFVVEQFSRIARSTGCAIGLVHHTRKQAPGARSAVDDIDISRGASALNNAARVSSNLNVMSKTDAEELGLDPDDRRFYVRLDDAKGNMSAPSEYVQWYRRAGVELPNGGMAGDGDSVGVLVPWTPPAPKTFTVDSARDVFNEIQRCWKDGEPFSSAPQSDRYLVKWMIEDHKGLKKQDARNLMRSWLETGKLSEEKYDRKRKMKGLKVREWL